MERALEAKTKFHTSVIKKDVFQLELKDAAKDFIRYFSSRAHYDIDLLPVGIADEFNFVNFVAEKKSWNECVRKIFLQCYVDAELKQACSGLIAVYMFSLILLNDQAITIPENDIQKCGFYCTKNEAFKSLKFFINDDVYDLIKKIIDNIGMFGTISVDSTTSSIPTLEFFGGHTFDVGLHQQFIYEDINLDTARIILFDGAIPEIGQVDNIFTQANEKNEKIIIVARSFGDDVISTINVNMQRNTLGIFPIVVKDDISHINLLFDLSTCTGSEVITSQTGKRLSHFNLNDFPNITTIKITKKEIKFDSKPEFKNAIKKRIKNINNRIDSALWDDQMSADDIKEVFSNRINSLSSNIVKLWVPGSDEFLIYLRKNFNFSLNYISSFANTGKIITKNFGSKIKLPKHMPANIFEQAFITSRNSYQNIMSVGCYIVNEK